MSGNEHKNEIAQKKPLGMQLRARGIAAALHFTATLVFASMAAILVFFVWFPYPYREVSGGRELFTLIVIVDTIMGPLLTFVVFNRKKPNKLLWRDMAVIVVLQFAALGYGVWSVFNARPIYLVFEVDRFKVVTRADIDHAELSQALPQFREFPWYGIRLISARTAQNNSELFSSVNSAIAGKDISAMPSRWQEMDSASQEKIRQRARDFAFLRGRAKDSGVELDRLIKKAGLKETEVIALPLVSRNYDWSVLMNKNDLKIIGYVPIDAF